MLKKAVFGVVAILLLAMVAAACGGSSSSSTNSDSELGVQEGTGSRQAEAVKAAEAAAKESGPETKLPPETIGLLQIVSGQESADRLQAAAERAAEKLNWKVIVCNSEGDPTKMASCTNSLINQGVDGLATIGIEPSLIAAQLSKAKAKGIPAVQGGGSTQLGDYNGTYGPDDAAQGRAVAEILIERTQELEGEKAPIAVQDFPAEWAHARTDELKKAIKSEPNMEIAAEATTEGANLVNFTHNTTISQLTAEPDMKAFWYSYDAAGTVGAQTIAQKFAGKTFPEAPLIATFDADRETLQIMHEGGVEAIVGDAPYDAGMWIAFDNLAAWFARERPFAKGKQPSYPDVGSIYDYAVVTNENLPAEGQIRTPKVDFPTFFAEKWNLEYGTGNK
jgi:ABC-type sugar transport system substrate-binding protein